jgi:O-acetyl-ADP-ribose deacetylase (regulator of RNase III)
MQQSNFKKVLFLFFVFFIPLSEQKIYAKFSKHIKLECAIVGSLLGATLIKGHTLFKSYLENCKIDGIDNPLGYLSFLEKLVSDPDFQAQYENYNAFITLVTTMTITGISSLVYELANTNSRHTTNSATLPPQQTPQEQIPQQATAVTSPISPNDHQTSEIPLPKKAIQISQPSPVGTTIVFGNGTTLSILEGGVLRAPFSSVYNKNVPVHNKRTAIVNAANEQLWYGTGVAGAIAKRGGAIELQKLCDALPEIHKGVRCLTGAACITTSGSKFSTQGITFIIQAVGPTNGDKSLLKNTYIASLRVAEANGIQAVALPLISACAFGFGEANSQIVGEVAINEFFADGHPSSIEQVYLMTFDKTKH